MSSSRTATSIMRRDLIFTWTILCLIAVGSATYSGNSVSPYSANYVPRTDVIIPDEPVLPPFDPFAPSNMIVNGETAVASDHGYHGSLQEFSDGMWHHVCGATLLNRTAVLLAAHCLPFWGRREYRVALGWQSLSLGEMNPNSQVLAIKSVQLAPEFDPCMSEIMGNDIAVGILQGRANTSSPAVSPIMTRQSGNVSDLVGMSCQIVGFGISEENGTTLTDMLQKTNVTVIDSDLCARFWSIDPNVEITDEMICTLDWPYRLSSVCQGDSGGSLVCGNEAVGVVSFSNDVCNGCVPSVHTTTASFTRFLRGILPP